MAATPHPEIQLFVVFSTFGDEIDAMVVYNTASSQASQACTLQAIIRSDKEGCLDLEVLNRSKELKPFGRFLLQELFSTCSCIMHFLGSTSDCSLLGPGPESVERV